MFLFYHMRLLYRSPLTSTPSPTLTPIHARSSLRFFNCVYRWTGFRATPGSGSKRRRRNAENDDDDEGGSGWGDVLLMSQRPFTPPSTR